MPNGAPYVGMCVYGWDNMVAPQTVSITNHLIGSKCHTQGIGGILYATLDDARIHLGIPLTLYDVCIH